MKKTFAALGATAVGFAVVGAGAAAPAAAADTTEPCEFLSEQFTATGHITDNWYQDCVPQYGLGKAEFTIVADEDNPATDFPAEFVALNELPSSEITVTSSTSDIAAMATYFDTFADAFAPITPENVTDSGVGYQTYSTSVIAPVTSIGAVADEDVPDDVAADCNVGVTTYGGGWLATFGAVDTTFAQTINGEPWNYTITATPKPMYYFGTIDTLPITGDWCVSNGDFVITSASTPEPDVLGSYLFALVWPTPVSFEGEALTSLGTFARDSQPVVPAEVLADTGVDGTPLIFAAGAFTAFGIALLGFTSFASRRRRTHD